MSDRVPDLVGSYEIRMRLGGRLSRQRIYQLTMERDFPRPVAELTQGKVWLASEVEEWAVRCRPALLGGPDAGRSPLRPPHR